MSIENQIEEIKRQYEEKEKESESNIQLDDINKLDILKAKKDIENKSEQVEAEIHKRAVENIKISEMERIKIYKHDFTNKDEVIDILLYTVGKMALDPLFYSQNIKKLKDYTPLYK